jgi:hypothetical protein
MDEIFNFGHYIRYSNEIVSRLEEIA